MEPINVSFTDCHLRSVTRSYKTHEALLNDLEKEYLKIRIKRKTSTDPAMRKRLGKAGCELMTVIYNNSVQFSGRQLFNDPTIEVR